ncbi:MAG: hypothetical protein AAGD13_16080 [Pseudomonadota bacterium]
MSRHFSATLLLDRPWRLNIDAVATALRSLFPQIGEVDSVPGQAADEDAGVLIIEGATVVVQSVDAPVDSADLTPPLRPLRAEGADAAATQHSSHVIITAGGALPGLEGGEAYAALVHFVAAAALTVAPASAVFWRQGWALTRSSTFSAATSMLLEGKMPVGTWVSFASVVPSGYRPEDGMGMVTYGMRPFVGRELELAPRPGDARSAFQTLGAICRMLLDKGTALSDGARLRTDDDAPILMVRERTYWLRRDLSAFVLVSEDAIVDSETLKPRSVPA